MSLKYPQNDIARMSTMGRVIRLTRPELSTLAFSVPEAEVSRVEDALKELRVDIDREERRQTAVERNQKIVTTRMPMLRKQVRNYWAAVRSHVSNRIDQDVLIDKDATSPSSVVKPTDQDDSTSHPQAAVVERTIRPSDITAWYKVPAQSPDSTKTMLWINAARHLVGAMEGASAAGIPLFATTTAQILRNTLNGLVEAAEFLERDRGERSKRTKRSRQIRLECKKSLQKIVATVRYHKHGASPLEIRTQLRDLGFEFTSNGQSSSQEDVTETNGSADVEPSQPETSFDPEASIG